MFSLEVAFQQEWKVDSARTDRELELLHHRTTVQIAPFLDAYVAVADNPASTPAEKQAAYEKFRAEKAPYVAAETAEEAQIVAAYEARHAARFERYQREMAEREERDKARRRAYIRSMTPSKR